MSCSKEEDNKVKRRYYRISETIFKKLAELSQQTDSTGFIVLCSLCRWQGILVWCEGGAMKNLPIDLQAIAHLPTQYRLRRIALVSAFLRSWTK